MGEYYEIRLESIGGLGANLCGKMLGELGLKYLDVNSQSFASYGSEKTGTPVKGYIRYCNKEKEIRVHSPVVEPDLLVVFHQSLLRDESVLKGCGNNTSVIIALEEGQEKTRQSNSGKGRGESREDFAILEIKPGRKENALNFGTVYSLPAQKIAIETHSRINVVMLGAILKVMGMSSPEAGEKICRDTLGRKYPDALDNNLEGIRRGFQEVRKFDGDQENALERQCNFSGSDASKVQGDFWRTGRTESTDTGSEKPAAEISAEWGYKNAPIGGINPRFGSTVVADLSPSRQGYIPLFIKERCINCGLCHSTCPDMVFQFAKGKYRGREMMINRGLDYYHCKGCLRCVDVCPVEALVRGVEAEHPDKQYFMPNQELLRRPEYYEESGPDGYITSESFLTEKRMEGGEV